MSIYQELDYTSDVQKVTGMQFGIFSPEEIRKQSVAEITKQETYINNEPVVGGLFDPRMGVLDHNKRCKSCEQLNYFCPGHFGHINLARPVFFIHFMPHILKVLKCVCISCSSLLINKNDPIIKEILKKNNKNRNIDINLLCSNIKRCGDKNENGCGAKQPTKYIKESISKVYAEWKSDDRDNQESNDKKLLLTAEYVHKIFKRISDEDAEILGFSRNWCRPDWMICNALIVPPPHVRPTVQQDNNQRMDDDLTHKLVDIIKANKIIKSKIETNANQQIIDDWTQVLQYHIATFIDNEIPGIPCAQQRSGRPLKSVRQRLKAKEGRVRGNLMGKRVDFSARSVITPDPNISIDQLGVPYQIAMNLTFPEVVTKFNIHKMYKYVRNGSKMYPGANSIKRISDGKNISLEYADKDSIILEEGDIVHRHLINDDVVLFNRQPSLHKMSMMAHRVKVMDHSTFRLNVSVTSPYNADFDGDEMNMHAPQSIQARYEIKSLASVPSQIISPRENKPVISIVQDSLLGANRITRDSVYFNEKQMMDLLMWNKSFNGILPEPIYNSDKLKKWSSHQLLSQILPNITINMPNKSFSDENENTSSNNFIKIINGEFLQGRIDKDILTKTSRGLVQVLFNDYGEKVAQSFLDNIQNIITNYLLRTGFSVGISDLIAGENTSLETKQAIAKELENVSTLTQHVHLNIFDNSTSKTNNELFEDKVTSILNKARRTAESIGVKSLSNDNRIVNMVKAGSKGNELNISQMISCVGQQTMDGSRIPYGFADRTLPHYSKYNDGPESRGFVESSFIDGLKPQEFFFHAMGGREGLIDTAVKTSETGYIQRKLVKAMEDLSVKYDNTVRNAGNNIIQFVYGDDGMDSTKVESQFLEFIKFNTEQIYSKIIFEKNENFNLFLNKKISSEIKKKNNINDLLLKEYDSVIEYRNFIISKINNNSINPLIYYPINIIRLINTTYNKFKLNSEQLSDLSPYYILDTINKLKKELVINENNHSNYLLIVLITYYLSPKILIKEKHFTKDSFDYVVNNIIEKFYDSIVKPGEMVGAIAAQSIGEPATQMTLNTFHFAGVGEKSNVTRGVPRLKELLSISRNQKNPTLFVFLEKEYAYDREKATKVMNKLEYTPLRSIVSGTKIYYDPSDCNTLITNDSGILDVYNTFSEFNQEILSDTSLWVLRLEFDRKIMMEKEITMYDVYHNIKQVYGNNISCVFSDDNSSELIFRIRIKDLSSDNSNYFDDSSLLKTLESNLLEKITIRGINNINKVSMFKKSGNAIYENGEYIEKDEWKLETDGINLLDAINIDEVDSCRTFSNDIYEVYETFGIEAARYALIKEITDVIAFEGAYVNSRHISLLCDIMTNKGSLMSIDRHGINRGDIGPLAKSSFEETTDQLIKASIFGEHDKINGVSSNIMMGQLAPCGTGICNILLDEEKFCKLNDEFGNLNEEYDNYNIDSTDDLDDEMNDLFEDAFDECSENNIMIDYNEPTNDITNLNYDSDFELKVEGIDVE